MRLCHFTFSSSEVYEQNFTNGRMGILWEKTQTHVLDVHSVWAQYFKQKNFYTWKERALQKAPYSLFSLLQNQEHILDFFQETLSKAEKILQKGDLDFPILVPLNTSFQFKKPLDKIGTYRDFYTFETHVRNGFAKRQDTIPPAWYEIPVYYKGQPYQFIGPNDIIPWPSYSQYLDIELEYAAVIGRDGYNLTEKNAYDHILGFTLLNDISARDMQRQETSVRLGPAKGKDFCNIIGPVITTVDEFNFSHPEIVLKAFVNKEQWSQGNTNSSSYSFGEMLEYASREEWLVAGDLIGSGTLGKGCGMELGRQLQPGDEIRLEGEKIGILENFVGIPQGPYAPFNYNKTSLFKDS